jgi:hypothetical protein
MSEGLVTRIGKWIDQRWADKVTEAQLEAQDRKCVERHFECRSKISDAKVEATEEMAVHGKALAQTIKRMAEHHDLIASLETKVLAMKSLDGDALNKEVTDLKTRIERIEVGTGMYRKIDPTKAPVAKTAFQM